MSSSALPIGTLSSKKGVRSGQGPAPTWSAISAWCSDMSDSDYNEIEVEGRSSATRPEQALREALSALGASLAARGGAPFHLVSMQWLAPNPAVFDPKIHALDLCYREVFGGFRPPISVAK